MSSSSYKKEMRQHISELERLLEIDEIDVRKTSEVLRELGAMSMKTHAHQTYLLHPEPPESD